MYCEGTVVRVKLPDDGVNKHRNAYKQKLISE